MRKRLAPRQPWQNGLVLVGISMEGDEERLQETVDSVYTRIMGELEPLMKAIAPDLDPTLMVMSLSGMVFHHLEVRKLIPLLPGGSEEKNALPVLADHIAAVVLGGWLMSKTFIVGAYSTVSAIN